MFDLNDGGLLKLLTASAGSETASVFYYILVFGVIVVASYLLGSINTAILVSRLRHHDDIRKYGSGNAGLTNMYRTYGKTSALLTLFGDMLKTILALVIGGVGTGFMYLPGAISISPGCYLAGLFCVIGHIFPVFSKFRGGKGVLATATVGLCLSPLIALFLFAIFCAVLAISKYVSLGSVSVAILYPISIKGMLALIGRPIPFPVAISAILMSLMILGMHLPNLKRIGERTENKFSFKKKKTEEESTKNDN